MPVPELFPDVYDIYRSHNSRYHMVQEMWGKYIVSYQGRFGILNKERQIEVPVQWGYKELAYLYMYKELIPEYKTIYNAGLYGLINKNKELIIPPEWDDIVVAPVAEAKLFIVEKNGKFGLLNNQNQIVIPVIWDILKTACFDPESAPDHWVLFARNNQGDQKWVIFTIEGKKILERIDEISERIFLIDQDDQIVRSDYVLLRRGDTYGSITIGKQNRDYHRIRYSKEDLLYFLQCIFGGPQMQAD
ncbi:MAG: WG repeat-containing protein [Bacteroidales bacterium]|nr:WG repeat-containing protein [Bacteroidales bacterium]